jgi:hypothetical protein
MHASLDGDVEALATCVSDEDLTACLRVLRALASEDGVCAEFRQPRLKPLRVALQPFLDDVRGKLFSGQHPDKITRGKEAKRRQVARAQQERAMDRQAADKTFMRAERLRMLEGLQAAAPLTAPLVPDGAVGEPFSALAQPRLAAPEGSMDVGGGEETSLVQEGGGGAVAAITDALGPVGLQTLRACYTCKTRYRQLHHFYAQLCPSCAELNFAKRTQVVNRAPSDAPSLPAALEASPVTHIFSLFLKRSYSSNAPGGVSQ